MRCLSRRLRSLRTGDAGPPKTADTGKRTSYPAGHSAGLEGGAGARADDLGQGGAVLTHGSISSDFTTPLDRGDKPAYFEDWRFVFGGANP